VDFVLDWIKDVPERQSKDIEYLNSKIVQAFTAGSVVIGLGGFSTATSPLASGQSTLRIELVTSLGGTALAVYVILAFLTFVSIRGTQLDAARLGARLWRRYWTDDVPTIKRALIHTIGVASTNNERILRSRNRTVQVVIGLTILEVVLVIGAIAAGRVQRAGLSALLDLVRLDWFVRWRGPWWIWLFYA
jgi:hypothetical protein